MKTKIIGSIISLFFLFTACTNNNIYFQYQSVNPNGWNADSLYVFDIEITDTLSEYNVYINVRNTPAYKNQNLWLFITEEYPNEILTNDTIEFYLADIRGKWLGSGAGALKEMPVLYKQNIKFEKSGIYTYKIGHGMRYDELIGINDVGIRVEKIKD